MFKGLGFRQLVAGVASTIIAFSPIMANAACFTDSEWRAAHVRILQTELQVAALECANVEGHSYNDQYSSFIARFQDRLKANATLLISHFKRVYGGGSGRELDSFVTRIANDASGRSMTDMRFCANSGPAFQAALSIDKENLEQAAVDRVVDHSEIGEECPANPVKVTKIVAKTPVVAPAKKTTAANSIKVAG